MPPISLTVNLPSMARVQLDMGADGWGRLRRDAATRAGRHLAAAQKIDPDNVNVLVLLGKLREDRRP
jgi:hypothetical protein